MTRRSLELLADRVEAVYASHRTPVRCIGGDVSPQSIRLTVVMLTGSLAVAPGQGVPRSRIPDDSNITAELALSLRRPVAVERIAPTEVVIVVGYTASEQAAIDAQEGGTTALVLAEPEPVSIVAEPEPVPVSVAAETLPARPVSFLVTLGLTAAWCIAAVTLFLAGALTPLDGNVAFYLLAMAGIFCGTFLTLTWPRTIEEKPEQFWTWGRVPAAVGQCTPSRQPLTGRGGHE